MAFRKQKKDPGTAIVLVGERKLKWAARRRAAARGLREIALMLFALAAMLAATVGFLYMAEESTLAVGGFSKEKEILAVGRDPSGLTIEIFGKKYVLSLR